MRLASVERIVRALNAAEVPFIVVGGLPQDLADLAELTRLNPAAGTG